MSRKEKILDTVKENAPPVLALGGIVTDVPAVAALAPLFIMAQGVSKRVAYKRASNLLNSIEKAVGSDNGKDIESLLQELDDNFEAQELFYDAIRAAIDAPSERARNAIALIFYSEKKLVQVRYEARKAMQALLNVQDEDIDAFLVATDIDMLNTLVRADGSSALKQGGWGTLSGGF